MDASDFDLGVRIRSIRKLKKMTIKEVAAQAGVTIGLISQIERNLANPSVKSLRKIAEVLGVPIATLFSQQPQRTGPVVRKEEWKVLGSPETGVTYNLLTPDFNRAIELVYGVYEPGAVTGEFLFVHAGEECCHILEGEMKLTLGETTYLLSEGDTISFKAMTPHKIENAGNTLLRALWAITPPPF
ncbi:MAG TPA: cupin domain-containing protein [Firmicutes bacterium]|nr:cupin domain-containing protein [Bacillota bacterium]